jgi:hypothetical protein
MAVDVPCGVDGINPNIGVIGKIKSDRDSALESKTKFIRYKSLNAHIDTIDSQHEHIS